MKREPETRGAPVLNWPHFCVRRQRCRPRRRAARQSALDQLADPVPVVPAAGRRADRPCPGRAVLGAQARGEHDRHLHIRSRRICRLARTARQRAASTRRRSTSRCTSSIPSPALQRNGDGSHAVHLERRLRPVDAHDRPRIGRVALASALLPDRQPGRHRGDRAQPLYGFPTWSDGAVVAIPVGALN
jgi:hypothetical protein